MIGRTGGQYLLLDFHVNACTCFLYHIHCPLKVQVMADIKMSDFTQTTEIEYVYAEAADGSQVKIKKSDFMELLRAELGYSFLKNNPNEAIEDCNIYADFSKNGLYIVDESTQNRPPESNYRAILMVLSRNGYHYQEYIEVTTGKRYYRYYTSSWSGWESITLT